FIHHFFNDKQGITDDKLTSVVTRALPKGRAREWYSALMDYGTYLSKTVVNPNLKSKHYKKQSAFAPSLRRVRGEILKMLNAHNGVVTKKVLFTLPFEKEKI